MSERLGFGRVAGIDDPWGNTNWLEWAISCPPPRHNFKRLPRIRSVRPVHDERTRTISRSHTDA
jgi:heme/copper-type cytochrome/quinol oxidase subunit 1